MLNKRGQGLSLTTIIIAILVLIVLIVLILILTGKMGTFSKGAEESSACNKFCKSLGKKEHPINSETKDDFGSESCKSQQGGSVIPAVNGGEITSGTNEGKHYVCCCIPN